MDALADVMEPGEAISESDLVAIEALSGKKLNTSYRTFASK